MALTLTEGELYSTTEMQRAVIDRLVKDSEILQRLKFTTILGNSLTYDTITTDAGADVYGVGDTWVESTATVGQATANLKILGGDADIDNFLLETRANKIDLKGTVMENKVKAVQYKFLDLFFYGDATTNTKEFSGLHKLISSQTYNTVLAGATTGSALSVAKLREAIDLITGFKPTVIVTTKKMKRAISVYLDSIGDRFPRSADEFGKPCDIWDGIPIIVDDHMVNTELPSSGAYSAKTGGSACSMFILNFEDPACCGLHSGKGVQVEQIGALETKDAQRFRVKWYCGLMFQDLRSCAKVDGILPASAVTA